MNPNVSSPKVTSKEVRLLRRPAPPRSFTVILLGLLIFTAAVTVLLFRMRSQVTDPRPEPALRAGSRQSDSVPRSLPEVLAQPATMDKSGSAAVAKPGASLSSPAVGQPSAAAGAELPPSAVPAQQVVKRILGLDLTHATPEQALQIKQAFQNLVGQGPAAVPAIREFLNKNQDLSFAGSFGEWVGFSSLRTGLFDALRQIGGPEAQGELLQTLHLTGDPAEVALLARTLEQLAPGQFRQEALTAARETLDHLAANPSSGDAAPLFQMLKNYTDASIASELAGRASQWPYYAVMTLASLPQDQGVPILRQLVQNQDPASAEARTMALRMLAQLAPQDTAAASALADLARSNQISERNWRQIVAGISGDQYQFGTDSAAASATTSTPGFKTYHIEKGNQNFYSLPVSMNSQVAQRIALIDQLLGAVSNPSAAQQLQQARATLAGPK